MHEAVMKVAMMAAKKVVSKALTSAVGWAVYLAVGWAALMASQAAADWVVESVWSMVGGWADKKGGS